MTGNYWLRRGHRECVAKIKILLNITWSAHSKQCTYSYDWIHSFREREMDEYLDRVKRFYQRSLQPLRSFWCSE